MPSVFFKFAIPDDISGSWYSGKVHISLKEGTFEPSSPIRYATELISQIEADIQSKPVLFLKYCAEEVEADVDQSFILNV